MVSWDGCIFRDDGASSDDSVGLDLGAGVDGSAHANEGSAFDFAGIKDGVGSDEGVVSYFYLLVGGLDDSEVLYD